MRWRVLSCRRRWRDRCLCLLRFSSALPFMKCTAVDGSPFGDGTRLERRPLWRLTKESCDALDDERILCQPADEMDFVDGRRPEPRVSTRPGDSCLETKEQRFHCSCEDDSVEADPGGCRVGKNVAELPS